MSTATARAAGATPAVDRRSSLRAVPPAALPVPRAPFVILVLTLLGGGLVALLLLNTSINENAFRLHDLQMRQQALDLHEDLSRRDVERLEAPGTLIAAARRMGLVPAGSPAFIRLSDGKVLGNPKPATVPKFDRPAVHRSPSPSPAVDPSEVPR
jgi:hypothetical protein